MVQVKHRLSGPVDIDRRPAMVFHGSANFPAPTLQFVVIDAHDLESTDAIQSFIDLARYFLQPRPE
jgi:hypothetical protein